MAWILRVNMNSDFFSHARSFSLRISLNSSGKFQRGVTEGAEKDI